jgi:hypothetical protein
MPGSFFLPRIVSQWITQIDTDCLQRFISLYHQYSSLPPMAFAERKHRKIPIAHRDSDRVFLNFCFFCIKTKERAKTIFPALFVLHAYPFGFFSFNRKAKTNHSKATNNQDSYFLSIQNLYAKSWHCRQYP